MYKWELFIAEDKRRKCVLPAFPPTDSSPEDPTRVRVYALFINAAAWEENGAIISAW